MTILKTFPVVTSICFAIVGATFAAVLEVGNDKPFQQLEKAVAAAKDGDEIVVHPPKDGSAYRQTALLVRVPNLMIRAADPQKLVELDGDGFLYSGKGSVPRAIVQFDPTASGCTLDGFRLVNAHNESHNGSGVRINQASDVTIRNCEMHGNDMGIMSNGEVSKQTGARQLIEKCTITDNGTEKDPGYNHNLYLGGTSVTVRECTIARSVTGNNLKSRAHLNFIVNNKIHDSCNRELDLVDAEGNTDIPGSDSFLIGNKIAKDPKCNGNKAVIHFGRDGKASHDGNVWLIGNTIHTPFISPVVDVSSGRGVVFIDNIIDDTGASQKGVLANLAQPSMKVMGKQNKIPTRFTVRQSNGESVPISLETPPDVPKSLRPQLLKTVTKSIGDED
jgi:hypothetical protein